MFRPLSQLSYIVVVMGNQAQTTRKLTKNSRYNRNNYSLDQMSAQSKLVERIPPEREALSLIMKTSVPQLPQPQPSPRQIATSSPTQSVQSLIQPSISITKTKAEDDQRLAKLNLRNDELRKQLIRMNGQLTSRLQRKKYVQKKRDLQTEGQDSNKNKLPALRRELQNGYRQIDRYKRIVEGLKGTQSLQNEQVVNEMQAKIAAMDSQIRQLINEIEASKNIDKNQQIMIKKSDSENNNLDLKEVIKEIEKLKAVLKKIAKSEREKFYKERNRQEYMFQLERRYRELNGDYLPELKSYANKNFVPEPKYEKKKKEEELNGYKPEQWELSDAKDELKTLKEKHEEYHVKIEKAIKTKGTVKEQYERVKLQLQQAHKTIENLHYKKDRYLQLVMGNLDFLMNQDDNLSGADQLRQIGSTRVITKGEDVQDQVTFDDHNLIKNLDIRAIKIVSLNVWYTNKRQIAAIQAIYFNGKDCFMGNRTSSVSEDMEKEVLQVEEGDYIKNVMGSFSKKGAIEFLAFNSIRGKAKQFGKEMINGLNFSLGLSKRERPVCLAGCCFFDGSYWRINKLTIDIAYDE